MRILALHGMGTNASIFEAQLSRICGTLEDHGHELIFVDGQVDCAGAQEIAAVYPEPYLCFYPSAQPALVEAAQSYIHEIIDEEGPFDGVIGFSQGAALAASLILEHQKEHPNAIQGLFKFAIFAGASLPFNKHDRIGLDLWENARNGTPNFKDEFAGEVDVLQPLGFPPIEELENGILARYHPDKSAVTRINIPTLHVIGKKDRYAPQSRMLVKLCAGAQAIVIDHEDDHRMPRAMRDQDKVARAIMLMIDRESFRA